MGSAPDITISDVLVHHSFIYFLFSNTLNLLKFGTIASKCYVRNYMFSFKCQSEWTMTPLREDPG